MENTLKVLDPQRAKDFFENKLNFTASPMEIKHLMDEGEAPHIIDVRSAVDFEMGHIPGALNIPEEKWGDLTLLKKDQTNVIYCYSHVCHLGAKAAYHFASHDFPVLEMEGGWKAWGEFDLPVEQGLHFEKNFAAEKALMDFESAH